MRLGCGRFFCTTKSALELMHLRHGTFLCETHGSRNLFLIRALCPSVFLCVGASACLIPLHCLHLCLLIQGQMESDLNDLGRQQARAVGEPANSRPSTRTSAT